MGGRRSRNRGAALSLAAAVAALALALGLAACGGGGGIESGSGGNAETVKLQGKPSGSLTISNWPLYIDKGTVPAFEKQTGISVKYIEDINDNAEFFGKMQPLLAQGQSGGRSIFVLADWMVNKMFELGYLQNLDKAGIPNVEANLSPTLRHPGFDPNRDYTVPWQSGMTGAIVRTDLAPEVRSICDLFDPKYKGKVDMLSELRETVPLVMKCMGIDPDTATEADWLNTIDKIKGAVESGQIRRFTGNDYARDLTSGDAVAVIGWSGDAVQLTADNKNVRFKNPKEGFMVFTDSMQIPVGAPHAYTAEKMIDFVYDPEIAAKIAAYVNYVPPVKGTKEVLAKSDPEIASSPLLFPNLSNAHNFKTFSPTDEREIDAAFQKAIGA